MMTALPGYLAEQTGLILDGIGGLREGADPIHDTRVAIRRTRGTVRIFARHLDRDAARTFDDELKWFAGLLGEVRDPQVQQRRLRAAVRALPDALALGPVEARIQRDLHDVETTARAHVTEAMQTPRFDELVTALRRWRTDPPVRPGKKLRKSAARADRKARKRLAQALGSDDDAPLHRARKAAKRARYAAELLQHNGETKHAKRTEKHHKRIQKILGDLQDTVVARPMLRRLGADAGTSDGENGFTFGLLYAREEQLAARCRRDVASRAGYRDRR